MPMQPTKVFAGATCDQARWAECGGASARTTVTGSHCNLGRRLGNEWCWCACCDPVSAARAKSAVATPVRMI